MQVFATILFILSFSLMAISYFTEPSEDETLVVTRILNFAARPMVALIVFLVGLASLFLFG